MIDTHGWYWTELDVARLVDAGNTYIEYIDDAMRTLQNLRETEQRLKETEQRLKEWKEMYEQTLTSLRGVYCVYLHVFDKVERKMWTNINELPNFQNNQEIKEMQSRLAEKEQEYCQYATSQ